MQRQRLIILAAAIFFFTAVQSARAITLIPPSLEFGVKPGETLSTKVKLFNESPTDTVLYTSTDNFIAGDDQGTAKFTNTPSEDLASWIKASPDPIALRTGERADVDFQISVPANADPGGHYGAIFFGTAPEVPAGTSGVAVGNKVAALVILRVEGSIRESGALTSFATEGKSTTFSSPPVQFTLRFTNDGNVHLRPAGTIAIRNMLGGTTTTLQVNPSQGAVLPKTERKYSATWEKNMDGKAPEGFFETVRHEWNNFAFGPYTAEVALTYGLANDKTVSGSLRFWIFPWQLLLIALVIIVLLVLLIIFLVKRYNRWIIAKAKAPTKKS